MPLRQADVGSVAASKASVGLEEDGVITPSLPSEIVEAAKTPHDNPATADDDLHSLNRAHVVRILTECQGSKTKAAQTLGVTRRSLYRLLEKFEIQFSLNE